MKLLSNGRDWVPKGHPLSSKKPSSIRIGLHLTELLRKQHGNPQTTRMWARLQVALHKLSARPHHWRQHLHNSLKMEKVRQDLHRAFVIIIWSLVFCKEENLKVSITRWNMDSDLALFRFRENRRHFILMVQVIVFHTGQSLWNGPFSCLASVNALTSTEHISLWSLPVLTQFCIESTTTPHCSQDLCGFSL